MTKAIVALTSVHQFSCVDSRRLPEPIPKFIEVWSQRGRGIYHSKTNAEGKSKKDGREEHEELASREKRLREREREREREPLQPTI